MVEPDRDRRFANAQVALDTLVEISIETNWQDQIWHFCVTMNRGCN